MHGSMTTTIHRTPLARVAAVVVAVVVILSSAGGAASEAFQFFPELEITLSNDGNKTVFYACQMSDRSQRLYELKGNETYRLNLTQAAFPMRWCYLYINPNTNGFFWAFTVRSMCTKCFWSIDKHPSLYRADKGRWERQKLFMPPDFNLTTIGNDTADAIAKSKSIKS